MSNAPRIQQPTLTIRRMHWTDIPAVDHRESELFPVDHWSVEQWWRELAAEHNHYWIAQVQDTVIGYCGLSAQAPDADIQTIAIGVEFQGKGLGGQLLDFMLQEAEKLGIRFIFLEVRADNRPAISLYASRGFARISERVKYYPDGQTAIIMRRDGRDSYAGVSDVGVSDAGVSDAGANT